MECEDVEVEECVETDPQCETVNTLQCQTVPSMSCQEEPQETCTTTPQQICKDLLKQVCDDVPTVNFESYNLSGIEITFVITILGIHNHYSS